MPFRMKTIPDTTPLGLPETREPRETTGQKQNKAIKGS